MKTKTFLKKIVMPNIIWIMVLVCLLLSMLGVEGTPDLLHAFLIGLILELVVLALWGIHRLFRYYLKTERT